MDAHIFGIRHHGPGSARNLVTELRALSPQAVLIEGPPDANALIPYAASRGMKPPVALMVYDPTDFSQASYFPFAQFSPEWQALLYALKRDVPVSFIDLPVGLQSEWQGLPSKQMMLDIESHCEEDAGIRLDPLGYLARMAGHHDGEQWWEETFERWERMDGVFPLILELMTSLREEISGERGETQLREAYMRKSLRKAARDGHERVAVVCGAWHAPALANWKDISEKEDNAVLKGLKKKKTTAAWIPWSYGQLSRQTGYGAGVISPAWYHLLYAHRDELAIRWMTQAARLFREEGNEISSAHVIEATRLAETLAALRNRREPGLGELRDATRSVFCHGDDKWHSLIQERLVIGDHIGSIGKSVPKVPLQKDIEKRIRKARLSAFWEKKVLTTKNLDLRKESHLQTSYFLHSLALLGISWAKKGWTSSEALGSFHENWKLSWHPTHALRVAEAAVYGGTVEEACTNYAYQLADQAESLEALSQLIDNVLKADISTPVPYLSERLQSVAAQTHDVWMLMESLPPLLRSTRYGSIRKLNVEAILGVLDQILPRIFIGLPTAGMALSEQKSRDFLDLVTQTNHYLHLHQREADMSGWRQSLLALERQPNVHAYIRGGLCRLFFDRRLRTPEATAGIFEFVISPGQDYNDSALWLEGFLQKSGLLLIHHPMMWTMLDNWVESLSEQRFEEVLVLLRRAFSRIPQQERTKLMELVRYGHQKPGGKLSKTGSEDILVPVEVQKTIGFLLGNTAGADDQIAD